MSIGSTICSILYTVYSALKITFEAIIPFVFQMVKQVLGLLIKIFTMVNEVWKDISNLAVTLLAQFQKMLMDLIMGFMGNPFEKLCSNMWNCGALLLELIDGNSLLTRALFKTAELVTGSEEGKFECSRERYGKAIDYIKGVLNDFISFKDIVCNFGFTISFGVEELANKVQELQRMFSNWTKKQISVLNKGISMIEGLENSIGATGIFELLEKLASFSNCVLENVDICNEFSTVNNFISDVCSKFGIKRDFATGKFELDKEFLYNIISQFNSAGSFCDEISGLIDGLVEPGGSIDSMFDGINYSRAYDLTNFIKGTYNHFTSDDFSIKKDWDNMWSKLDDVWDDIMTNQHKLIIDNNMYAMGLYGLDDITIGDREIQYYMPYYYTYNDEGSTKIKYHVKDVTKIMKSAGYPTKYSENETMLLEYPNNNLVKTMVDSIREENPNLYDFDGHYYQKFGCFSEYVNLSNKIKQESYEGKNYIEIKSCKGGIMLFLNCFDEQPFHDNITSQDIFDYDNTDKESLSRETIVLDSNADLNSMYKKVSIGDYVVNVGTLSLAMRDFMQGKKDSKLLETFGEKNVEDAIKFGKRFYGFINIDVTKLATRYV